MKKSAAVVSTEDDKSVRLAIYLIKKEVRGYRECIKERAFFDEYDLRKELHIEGKVLVGKNKRTEPEWKIFLQDGIEGTIPKLVNASNRALVFFKVKDRWLVIPFGYGKYLLKDDVIDGDFGLRTALNLMDSDKILSLDRANIGDMTLQTRTQSSRRSTPEVFGIDRIRDLLRSITGTVSIDMLEKYGRVVSGNEAIYISPKVKFHELPEMLDSLLVGYRMKKYKSRFGWIDNLKVERDPTVIEALREKAIKLLESQDDVKVHLASPFIIDWEIFESVSYTLRGSEFPDLDIADLYKERSGSSGVGSWENLKKWKLYVKNGGADKKIDFPLWRFLNFQLEYGDAHYVFTLSNWYRVEKGYYNEVRDYCLQFAESDLKFPDARKGESEGDYNLRLASTIADAICLDKKLVKSDTGRSEIEACDVLAPSGEFIHVKHRYSSASLSHLFSQGKVSANSLRKDRAFRKNLRAKIKSEGMSTDLVPLEERDLRPGNYTITFAMLSSNDVGFVDDLPFFSLINFRLVAEELSTMGYTVKVKNVRIP
jgi:uncharacterized protein (TIGR04141 family)